MSSQRTIEEKVADWWAVYQPIRDTLTPEAFRALTQLSSADNVPSVNIGLAASRIVFANDRAAATVAALMTANGVKPVAIDYGDETA